MPDERDVLDALNGILDPCSVFNRTNLTITEMGLIRDVRIDGGKAHVRLILTDPSCLFYFQMAQEIEARLVALPGIEEVSVESTSDQWWSEERMLPDARSRLTEQRERRMQFVRDARRPPGTRG
mgnify:CR=1 FL=1|jgi:ATP-binding protein involved in chromosome partitioning